MKKTHKKLIAVITKDMLPWSINQGVGIINAHFNGQKEDVAREKTAQLEKLIKKVVKESGGQSIVARNIEDIGISKEELGRRTWNKIHNSVAALPQDANENQVKETMGTIKKMINEYPCSDCRENAQKNLKEIAERGFSFESVKFRTDAVKWAYDFHNIVNEDLKKEKFSIEDLKLSYDF